MTVRRMDHVGVVVDDLEHARAFFSELGLEAQGEASVEGVQVDSIVGLEGVRSDVVMMKTPDGHGCLELTKFHTPEGPAADRDAPAHSPGLRHVTFEVDDLDATLVRLVPLGAELVGTVERFGGSYRLCYVRGPEGIIIELAERLPRAS
jgi:catechol 2,3-dioxygenase-like lactoylglutathione lyase family enzyme